MKITIYVLKKIVIYDGIRRLLITLYLIIGGSRPQDIQVNNDKCYSMIMTDGDFGLGESYM